MSQQIYEHRWNPVSIGSNGFKSASADAASSEYTGTSWYNSYITNEGDRKTRLKRYDLMDRESIEAGRALDIIAEDISSSNADNEEAIKLEFETDTKLLKSYIKMITYGLQVWKDRIKFEENAFDWARELVKYGGIFFLKRPDGSLKKIRPEQLVGYILSKEDDTQVTHYIIDKDADFLDLKENPLKFAHKSHSNNAKTTSYDHISIEDMVVIKRGTTPFGESILERGYSIWRKLKLLEDAVVIYRVVRAPERRVFYIDVGRQPEKKHKAIIDRYKLQMRQRQLMKNGQTTTEFDPHSTTEDFYLPTTSSGRSSRIETLQGGQQLGEMSDLTYFARKFAASLRIPPSMTDTQNEGYDRDNYSDMRVGQVYQVEVRYMGFINRDKKKLERALREHFKWFMFQRDVILEDEVDLVIPESHNFALYKDIEVNQSLLNVFSTTTQIQQMSPRYAMMKYLNMDQQDLIENEMLSLSEKGVSKDVIKTMTEEEIHNIVYGDGRLGEKYGLSAEDPMRSRF